MSCIVIITDMDQYGKTSPDEIFFHIAQPW